MSLFSVITFIAIVATVWFIAWKKSQAINKSDAEGYFLGGRSLTGITIAGTILMTNLSTEQIVGQNGQSYIAGMEVMAWEVTAAFACVLLAFVFLPKYLKHGISTISDFIEIRYDTMTKRIISFLFLVSYTVTFLPVVLFSGALVFNKLFHIDKLLNVNGQVAIIVVAAFIGLIGLLYVLIGGISLSAFSDTIYGVGLIIGGISIPILGLIMLGKGSFSGGIQLIIAQTPEKLNAIGSLDSKLIPWPTLFFGMFFNNLFYWCTNQMIVQKALAGKNLKEAQKGALYVGFFKIFGALFLVFPGIIAYNMFGNTLKIADDAYPSLVTAVLPTWAYGIFGAVIFGAILSSFAGALNSTSTLFALDFYKPVFRPKASDKEVVRVGRLVTAFVAIVSIVVAPLIAYAPAGLYTFLQEYNGFYNMPLLAIILLGFYTKRVPALAAKVTMVFHIVAYTLSKVFFSDINFLYVLSGLFFLDISLMLLIGKFKPMKIPFKIQDNENKVDLTPWKYGKYIGIFVVVCMIGMYILFSPIGIAR
ncbi:solute:sodium symporter family transporter [Clostridium tagluense]|uniref:solute:sodium symporter family transporter n=1 Tax=Clostridium tagluense TaxID=360422 RepID=UPI001CF4C334|nr:solute:sodium symporter family transporter [Clostridium tagluense]MCB2298565.1 solute:sodium symporter family transporter [Clostridium tagluense]